jgi:hypothetical protein
MCELHNEWLSLPTTIMPAGIVPGIIISLMIADNYYSYQDQVKHDVKTISLIVGTVVAIFGR